MWTVGPFKSYICYQYSFKRIGVVSLWRHGSERISIRSIQITSQVNAFSLKQNLYIIVTDITLRNEQETNYEACVACWGQGMQACLCSQANANHQFILSKFSLLIISSQSASSSIYRQIPLSDVFASPGRFWCVTGLIYMLIYAGCACLCFFSTH